MAKDKPKVTEPVVEEVNDDGSSKELVPAASGQDPTAIMPLQSTDFSTMSSASTATVATYGAFALAAVATHTAGTMTAAIVGKQTAELNRQAAEKTAAAQIKASENDLKKSIQQSKVDLKRVEVDLTKANNDLEIGKLKLEHEALQNQLKRDQEKLIRLKELEIEDKRVTNEILQSKVVDLERERDALKQGQASAIADALKPIQNECEGLRSKLGKKKDEVISLRGELKKATDLIAELRLQLLEAQYKSRETVSAQSQCLAPTMMPQQHLPAPGYYYGHPQQPMPSVSQSSYAGMMSSMGSMPPASYGYQPPPSASTPIAPTADSYYQQSGSSTMFQQGQQQPNYQYAPGQGVPAPGM